ncbi:MAG: polysaccharide biosynthesis protein [Lachnospiraceae bacterium]|nr:polysaccharide biosynthesis protein [Lachnospiraceae bacterium]
MDNSSNRVSAGGASRKSGRSDSFVVQAGILAAAGLISRIIGLLYRSPLAAVIGDLGSGYYQAAYSIYTIVLLISSYSIPSAISKVIAQKLAVREYRNAHRVFICSTWYVLAIGGIASLFLFFGAGLLVDGGAIPVLRVFAPTIFLYGLLGVLRGYFQAHKSMVQTSVSQILEQIANAVISIVAAMVLIHVFTGSADSGIVIDAQTKAQPVLYGNVLGAVGGNYHASFETNKATYGAMGSALGTGAGVLAGLLFMWGIYGLNKKMIFQRIRRDKTGQVDSYGDISRTIMQVVTPFILSTAAYNLSTSLNSVVYLKLYRFIKEIEETTAYANYGIFSYKAVTISNIPVAFASAMASAMIPSIAQLVAKRQIGQAREKIGMAIKTTMIIAIPSAVGLAVLAKPVTWLLFPQKETVDMAANLLMALAVTVVFFSLSTLSSSILQGLGKVNTPIYNAAIALGVQTFVLVGALLLTDLDLYALVIANVVYSGLMCVLNQWAVRKAVGYRQEMVRTFAIPLVAAAFMGVIAWLVYDLMYLLTSSTIISVVPAIVMAVCVYFVMLIAFRGVNEQELRGIPKGYLLVKVAKKCKLLR